MTLPKRSPPQFNTHTSYPLNSELAPCFSTPELLASPPTTPPRSHKHSFSKPMSWLNRSSSSPSTHSTPHAAPKPTRVSEPKVGSSLDQFHLHRRGPLGSGATVVRTPHEALFGSCNGLKNEENGLKRDILFCDSENNENRLPSLSASPPLPPLPGIPDAEEGDRLSGIRASIPLLDHVPPRGSSLSSSPPSHFSPLRSAVLSNSPASCLIPTLPVDTASIPQPPFEPVLLSPIPDGAIDPSKLIVTLETCTTTYRILLRSLVSRPSHLSRYITSLLSLTPDTASVYSNGSGTLLAQRSNGFDSFFRDHFASFGCLPRSAGIHVFLDRPSAPYTHVLAYLRSLPSTPEHPETLPWAVQLGSTSPSRLESLLELRDEASYLGLTELEKLCSHEIQRFQHALLPTSTGGSTPAHGHSQTGSVHSFSTIVERCQSRQEVPSRTPELRISKSNGSSRRTAKSGVRESSSGSSLENKETIVRGRGKQGRGVKYGLGSPPPGWI